MGNSFFSHTLFVFCILTYIYMYIARACKYGIAFMDINEHVVSTMSMSMQMFIHASFNTWVRPLEFQCIRWFMRVSIHVFIHVSVNAYVLTCHFHWCGNQYTIYLPFVIANPYIFSHVWMPMHAFYQICCSNTTSIIWMFIMLNTEMFKCQRSQ